MFENTDSSDDNDDSLSKQVLPTIDDNNDMIDMNKMPTTGEEYLRQVRFEASKLPNFQTATKTNQNLTTSSKSKKHAWLKLFSSTNTIPDVPIKHIISNDWQNEQCLAFSNVRNDFFQMRDQLRIINKKYRIVKLKNINDYWKFCFGNDIPFQSPLSSLEIDEQLQIQNPLPTMTKMISLTQALYIYATLVSIEKPIDEDVMYTIRQTCIAWKQIRTKLLNPNDNDYPVDDTLIKICDLFICIIGRYFGQFDLADRND
ncbi:unnamed protein product [Rotaria sp. Silwood1]|nr:unnamed protein product [Rotaria sp. Silwood1]CAF1412890.1 unnamed protein product [Rotaria sp. Silwood1]CAF4939965.1 unnamed protein product [Rotaria sp. Silwood1]